MKLTVLFQLIVLILISSCAKTPGKTEAKFKLSLSSLTDLGNAGAGGAMLWGRSDKGDMFGVDISNSTSLDLELVNGTWTFWSVAWEGKNNFYNFQGLTRCAKSTSVFNGKEAQININLSNATCADTDFSPSVSVQSGVNEFPVVSRRECDKLSDFNGNDCGAGIGSNAKSTSRRLLMPSFKKAAGGTIELTGSALVSSCHNDTTSIMVDTHLPVGNGVLPAFTVLQSFFTSSICDETDPKGFTKENFEMGLKATVNSNAMVIVNNGTCNGVSFTETACLMFGGSYSAGSCNNVPSVVMSDIPESVCTSNGGSYSNGSSKRLRLVTSIPEAVFCSGKRIDPSITTPTVFASGTGIPATPYRICKEYQLNSIGGNFPDKAFVLNADLDMNATSVIGDQPMAACLSSKPGSNFIPIGGMYDGACNEIAPVSFGVGWFHGKGHTISNIRLHAKTDNVGFIRLDGSIYNLTLNNAEVEGGSSVGAFSGSTSGVLTGLLLNKSRVRGGNSSVVGGVVGSYYPAAGSLTNVHARKSFIKVGSAGHAGGLIGDTKNLSSSFTVKKSSFEGVIESRGNTAAIGGLIGSAPIAPLTLNESYSSGAMIVHGSDWAGGLVGAGGSTITINNSYSRMNIGPTTFDIGEGGNIGGLLGTFSTVATVTNSFYFGAILHPCFEKTTPCGYGSLSGRTGAVMNNASGTLLYAPWFKGATVTGSMDISNFETTATKNSFIQSSSPALFKDVGSSYVRLAWETDTCAQSGSNLSVATQSVTKGSISNPIVLCNKEQWAEIKNYPSLNYIVADNLGLGEITSNNMILSFSGKLNGDGYVVGGIYSITNSRASGIIADNYGKISNTIFAVSYFNAGNAPAPASGLAGTNKSIGEIFDNQLLSVNIESSVVNHTGTVAGINEGKIYRNKVSSLSSFSRNGGLISSYNTSTGIISGNRVEGTINLLPESLSSNVGLVAGINAGKISETDISGTLKNSATGNSGASSNIGAFVGENSGVVQDILIRPTAKLVVGITGPLYGQAIGQVLDGASVKNVLALNEVPVPLSVTAANVQSFIGYLDSGVTLKNSYQLSGNVFKLSSSPVVFTGCNQSGNTYSYDLSIPLALTAPYVDGFYLPNPAGSNISSKITSTLSNGAGYIISSADNGQFALPCSASGITNGTTTVYPFQKITDFNDTEVHSATLLNLKSFDYFCPSSTGASSSAKGSFVCNSSAGELNIVEDIGPTGFGYQHLLNAHKLWLQTGTPPASRPVWVMSDEGYPKLFVSH